jgi:clan AA aspartic protease (TIGR02281 family)
MKQIITLLILLPIIMFSQCVPKDGCNNGDGVYTFSNKDVFEGKWKNKKPWKGIYRWHEGDIFDGEWKNGKKWKGIYTWVAGDIFDGEWKNGKQWKGVMYSETHLHKMERYFENGQTTDKAIAKNFYNKKDVTGATEYTVVKLKKDISQNLYYIKIKISNVDTEFIFDTGAEILSIGLKEWRRLVQLGIKYTDLNQEHKAIGIGGNIEAKLVVLKEIQIGQYTIQNVIASIDKEGDNPSLFGISLLTKFHNATWNMQQNTLKLYK